MMSNNLPCWVQLALLLPPSSPSALLPLRPSPPSCSREAQLTSRPLPQVIKEPKTICLWLGANVMVEYTIEEAVGLLEQNEENAIVNMKVRTSLRGAQSAAAAAAAAPYRPPHKLPPPLSAVRQSLDEDIAFLRDQITTTEVSPTDYKAAAASLCGFTYLTASHPPRENHGTDTRRRSARPRGRLHLTCGLFCSGQHCTHL